MLNAERYFHMSFSLATTSVLLSSPNDVKLLFGVLATSTAVSKFTSTAFVQHVFSLL